MKVGQSTQKIQSNIIKLANLVKVGEILDKFNLVYKSQLQFYMPAEIKNEIKMTLIISIKLENIKYIIYICTRTSHGNIVKL